MNLHHQCITRTKCIECYNMLICYSFEFKTGRKSFDLRSRSDQPYSHLFVFVLLSASFLIISQMRAYFVARFLTISFHLIIDTRGTKLAVEICSSMHMDQYGSDSREYQWTDLTDWIKIHHHQRYIGPFFFHFFCDILTLIWYKACSAYT